MASYILAIAMAATVWLTFSAPNAVGFQAPELARIIFYHLPCAFLTTVFLLAGAFYSVRFLFVRERSSEVRAVAANEAAFLMGLLTMATGILFSKVQWGAWWHWDPRQTSFLLVLMIFAGYFSLRAAFADEERRAVAGAAYCALALLPSLFLIFVFPRMPNLVTFHPNTSIADTARGQGGFSPEYWRVILMMFVLLGAVALWAMRLRVRAAELERALEERDDALDDRGRAPATGVVRPVSLPPES